MKNLDIYRQKLTQYKQEVENVIKTMNENRTTDQEKDYPTELSNYDNHPADLGTQLYMVGLNNALMIHQENILQEVQNALKKIEMGEYGKCELCGKEIPEGRLEAISYVRLCLECQEDNEPDREVGRKSRPNEEL